jgi:hypothetical protein
VVTVAMTFVATAIAIEEVGAKPVFVDVDPQTRCLDPAMLEAAIGSATAAILPVHLHGIPAAMAPSTRSRSAMDLPSSRTARMRTARRSRGGAPAPSGTRPPSASTPPRGSAALATAARW